MSGYPHWIKDLYNMIFQIFIVYTCSLVYFIQIYFKKAYPGTKLDFNFSEIKQATLNSATKIH